MTVEVPRWQALWARWRHGVALLSFGAGIGSFLLIQRQERVAQALVFLLPLSWLLAFAEPALQRLAERKAALRLSPLLAGYLTQALHQESLFFTLPFFIATVTWNSSQTGFIVLMTALALVSIIDPLYYRHVLPRRALLWSFHAVAAFVTVLTAAPMLWQLTTTQSLLMALAMMGTLSLPVWWQLLRLPSGRRALLTAAAAVTLVWALWQLRAAIPPSTLRVTRIVVTDHVDPAQKEPGDALTRLPVSSLSNGLFVWSSIHAPRGLHERIEHRWLHNGTLVDVVPLDIAGGREAGYRAWSRKQSFGDDPRGAWEVRVATQSDQLIGVVRFRVD
ncbi:DUF2914 domain-containing protein [Sinimarinibacterium sp. CAU 1509]|uniref:DUF5924 family protein n=1 Tax=Sinimarinibacterium sp. CAU 1509 TaxID=2562283 RepID=UPI0010AB607E|nr:DUF5924 family protein [Sinimarinibacterium sp. CAU 1509]TJY59395.1 DUF2914 domain-containing protein [Sinimarinibacterium sp. CAU 1509]